MTFITEHNIANLYLALIDMPIFDEYRLPPVSKVDFVIVHDDTICGQYETGLGLPCRSAEAYRNEESSDATDG